jgi:hypothetical protein
MTRRLYLQHFSTSFDLVAEEDLTVTLIYVRLSSVHINAIIKASNSNKGATKLAPKTNSSSYKAQGVNNEVKLTEEQVLEKKVPKEYHNYANVLLRLFIFKIVQFEFHYLIFVNSLYDLLDHAIGT